MPRNSVLQQEFSPIPQQKQRNVEPNYEGFTVEDGKKKKTDLVNAKTETLRGGSIQVANIIHYFARYDEQCRH